MTTLVAALFVSIFTLDYLALKLELVSRFFTLGPELLSALATVAILGRALVTGQWVQSNKYIFLMLTFFVVCLVGIAAQGVAPGPIVAGLRNYLRYLPFFFLPAVIPFSDRQLRFLLIVLLCLVALQVPLSIFQRFVQFSDYMHTGDPIRGSVTTSSALSMIMALSVAALVSLYVYARVGFWVVLIAIALFMIPTTLNETKATALIMPIALLAPFLLARRVKGRFRKTLPVLALFIVVMGTFVVTYNALIQSRWHGRELQEYLEQDRLKKYLYRGERDSTGEVARIDSIILPMKTARNDWMRLLFGLGIGNVSPSFLEDMQGKYYKHYGFAFGLTTVGDLLWETGILGLLLFVLFLVFVLSDALRLARSDDTMRWLGTWWATACIILFFGLLYKSLFGLPEISYLMYFWSGVVTSRAAAAARRVRDRGRRDWTIGVFPQPPHGPAPPLSDQPAR